MSKRNKTKGFTIIEVVLVLAIAGLIFMMVFVALPALQRSQRDTARKNDVSHVVAAVSSYLSNNKGLIPTTATLASYVTDKSVNTTTISVVAAADTYTVVDANVYVMFGKQCGASTVDSQALVAGTTRQYAVFTRLEAGTGVAFCQNG